MKWTVLIIAGVFLVFAGSGEVALGKVIYVDADASGAGDGSCWTDGYEFLQDALSDANESDKPVEIRVAEGVYTPDRSAAQPDGTEDRGISFALISGVSIRGGYAGFGEADPNARDIELYETILSGDLRQNDVEVADPCELLNHPTRSDNSYHVVIADDANETAVLDGFSIIGGNAYGSPYPGNRGGGMHCRGYSRRSAPTLINCTFRANSAEFGGGMYCGWDGKPILINCTFRDNAAEERGGAVYDVWLSVFIDCRFVGNTAGWSGGAYANWDSGEVEMIGCRFERNRAYSGGAVTGDDSGVATLADCTFIENSAHSGGAIWDRTSFQLSGCRFIANSASETGGAITSDCGLTLTNCSFTGNSASEAGGAIAANIIAYLSNCTFGGNMAAKGSALVCNAHDGRLLPWSGVEMTNCILWDDEGEIWNNGDYPVAISYSDIKGGRALIHDPCGAVIWGEGNIDADPCFADPGRWDVNGTPEDANDDFWADGDYHLKSQGGRRETDEGGLTKDDVTSPCIDAGDPMSPIGTEPFPNGGVVNMGAYGGTVEASKSYFGKAPCEVIVAGDINGDCIIDFQDFQLMALHWCEDNN